MKRFISAWIAAFMAVFCFTSSANAVIVPFAENFSTDAANWRKNVTDPAAPTVHLLADYVSTGGPSGAGDAFISYARDLAASTNTQVIFRGQDGYNASGDAFVGDWLGSGITEFSFWVRHDGPAPLQIGTRFALGANFPAYSIFAPAPIPGNQWTQVTYQINESFPGWQNEGAPSFNGVFSAIGNVQIFAVRDANTPVNTTVTFGLDQVSVIPEPSSILLGVSTLVGAAILMAGRRKNRGVVNC